MNKEDIEKQAKSIMDLFLMELGSVKEEHSFGLQRETQMREPRHEPTSEHFRRTFLANAPKVKDDLLQMERKQW